MHAILTDEQTSWLSGFSTHIVGILWIAQKITSRLGWWHPGSLAVRVAGIPPRLRGLGGGSVILLIPLELNREILGRKVASIG